MDNVKTVPKGWGYELWIHNDEKYCGKLLHFENGKKCSLHFHKLKHETFYLQSGKLECQFISIEDLENGIDIASVPVTVMLPGDVKEIPVGLVHQMKAVDGPATLFEFSTQHFDSDSHRIMKGD